MDKLLCFKIDDTKLYKEIDLLDYQEPIFFVCIDDYDNRYLVLCIDIDEREYFIVKVTNDTLKSMLKAEIEMRDMFLETEKVYRVVTAAEIDADITRVINPNDIHSEDLPDEESYFTIKNNEIDSYIQKLSGLIYEHPRI